jgi:hypothetical protein
MPAGRDMVDQFQPRNERCRLQSMPLRSRTALLRQPSGRGRLHDAEAEQFGSTFAQPFEIYGSIARLYGMAPVRPHDDEQATMLGTIISPAPDSCRNSIRCRQQRAPCR